MSLILRYEVNAFKAFLARPWARVSRSGRGLALACYVLCGNVSVGQEELPLPAPIFNAPQPSVTLQPPTPPAIDEETLQELSDRQQQLQDLRNELTSKFMAADQTITHEGSSRRRTPKDIEILRDTLDDRRQLELSRSLRLQEKLRRLRDVIDQQQLCEPKKTPPADEKPEPVANVAPAVPADHLPATTEVPESTPGDVAVVPKPMDVVDTDTGTEPTEALQENVAAVEPPSKSTTEPVPTGDNDVVSNSSLPQPKNDVADAMVQALALVDGPVDRLGLANNLYATGELQLALEVYQKIDRSTLGENEQLWVEYQIANCYRKMDNEAEAERGYRIVTARDNKTWISANARWWLQLGSQRREVHASMNDLQRSLNDMKEAMRVNTTQ